MAISCNPGNEETEFQVTSGHWGHLTQVADTNPSPMYLSHIKKDQSYKICVPKYLSKKYPGIRAEIKAGINIWGHYIGRQIKVEILDADLPMPDESDDVDKVMEDYYALCPQDIHLVIGLVNFTDDALGQTSVSYSYVPKNGRREVKSFRRYLFLKMPLSSDSDQGPESKKVVWKSLAQQMKKELNDQQILELMKTRQETIYLLNDHEHLTLDVITHEFGHVWGLCDQYPDGVSHCDKNFALLDKKGNILPHKDSIMSGTSFVAKVFLTDDDIEGIRRLGERPEFSNGWPAGELFREIKIQEFAQDKPVPLAKIKSAIYKGQAVSLRILLKTNTTLTLSPRLLDKKSGSWLEFGDLYYDRPGTMDYTLDLNVGRYLIPEKVQVVLKYQDKASEQEEKLTLESDVKLSKAGATIKIPSGDEEAEEETVIED